MARRKPNSQRGYGGQARWQKTADGQLHDMSIPGSRISDGIHEVFSESNQRSYYADDLTPDGDRIVGRKTAPRPSSGVERDEQGRIRLYDPSGVPLEDIMEATQRAIDMGYIDDPNAIPTFHGRLMQSPASGRSMSGPAATTRQGGGSGA